MVAAVPDNRSITLGYAAETGPWTSNWSVAGVTAVQKADITNATEAWSAIKYTDVLPTTLAGGDIYRGDLGVSGQSSATSTVKQEIDGKEALRFNLKEAAQAVSIDLAAFYANDDGSGYAEAARVRLFDNGGNLVGETFVSAQSGAGNQLVQINSAQAFTAVELSAGTRRADGSFSYGGYSNSDGSFGTDSYTSGSKHGSDLLVNGISFTLARPTANGDNYTLQEDAASQAGNVLNNDSDPNHASLSAVLSSGPSHGALTFNADGSFSYLPDADYNGVDSFSYRASNGKDLSDIATVTLTVTAVNDAPTAVNDSASTDEDTSVSGNVLANDNDRDHDTLLVTNTGTFTTVRGATITINADGSFSYNAKGSAELQALASGASLVDSFTYHVSDGHGGTSAARLDITVQGRDEAGASVMQASVDPGTELVYYMRYTDAAGTSKWMEIDGLSLGAQTPFSVTKGTSTVGKTSVDAVTLELGSSKAVADFSARLFNGTHFTNIEIETYTAGSLAKPGQLVQEYRFTNDFVTSAQTRADANGATSNALSFVYTTIDQALTPLGADGKPVAAQQVSWNIGKPGAALPDGAAIDPGADVDLKQLANVTSTDATLTYYVHVDGVDGWVELSNFALGFTAAASATGGAAAVGKPVPSQVTLDLGLNQVLSTLFKNEISGKSAPAIQIEAYSSQVGAGGLPLLVDEYNFNTAFTGLVDVGSNASNTLSFGYGMFSHAHIAYRADGRVDSANSSNIGYDFVHAKPNTPTSAKADALAAGTMTEVPQDTPLTYYMRYTDASGTSKWMVIDSMSLGATAPVDILKGSGASAGRAASDGFTLTMGSGKALTDFNTSLFSGKTLNSIEIEAYASSAGGLESRLVQEYKFTGAAVNGVHTAAAENGATSNTLGFNYRTLDQAIITYSADGKALPAQKVSWDLVKNTATVAASAEVHAGADADLRHLAGVDDADAPLDYYLRVDGVDGWIALSNFSMGFDADSTSVKGETTVGKPVPTQVTVEMGLSQALSTLFNNELKGKQAGIQIEAYAHGSAPGETRLVDEYIFTKTLTTDVQLSGDTHNAVSFVYNAFSHSHLVYDASGSPGKDSSSTSYDFTSGKAASVPGAVADNPAGKLTPSVPEGTPLTYYLRYTDSHGTSKWMQIDAVSLGAQAESSFLKGSGGAVGLPKAVPLTLEMGSGAAANDLVAKILTGEHATSLEIEAYAPGGRDGAGQLVQEYRLTNAFVSAAQTKAGEDGATTNQVSFTYSTLDQGLYMPGADGKPVLASKVSWNVAKNTTTLPSGAELHEGADVNASRAVLNDSGQPLEYYIHIEGVSGWVALRDFSFGFSAESSSIKGAGGLVGKPVPTDVTLGLGLNQVLSTLMKSEFSGKGNDIQIEAYAHNGVDGERHLVDEYFFKKAYTTNLDLGSDASNELTLAYTSFTHSHLTYDELGRIDHSGVGFDFTTTRTIGVPDAVADVYH